MYRPLHGNYSATVCNSNNQESDELDFLRAIGRRRTTPRALPGSPLATPHEVGTIRIGCSGWQYRHWRGTFYPDALPVSGWFAYYAGQFDTVEINYTFYRLPEAGTFQGWRTRAPRGFVFAAKASRYLTHMKKLKDPDEPIARFFSRARALGRMLGPVLYQLPPNWPLDLDRLDTFLAALPAQRRHVLEFRNPTWYTPEVHDRMARAGVSLCLHDMQGSASGPLRVGPLIYLRLHGTARYSGSYGDDQLARWAAWLGTQTAGHTPAFVYFNNDIGGHAPRDATRLKEMLGQSTG